MTKKINQDNINTEFKCPVETALDVLAGKWKILIIWYLKDEKKRFNELQKLLPKATQKMLIQKLRELENDGIVIITSFSPQIGLSTSFTPEIISSL